MKRCRKSLSISLSVTVKLKDICTILRYIYNIYVFPSRAPRFHTRGDDDDDDNLLTTCMQNLTMMSVVLA